MFCGGPTIDVFTYTLGVFLVGPVAGFFLPINKRIIDSVIYKAVKVE